MTVSGSTNTFEALNLVPIINATAGTNTVYGFHYNPTLTSVTGVTHYGVVITPAACLNGFGVSAPTASVEIAAGIATRAPLRLTSGTNLTTPVAGSIEFTTDDLFFTITTGTARKYVTLNDVQLISGRLPYITTNGMLASANNYLFDTTNGLMLGGTSTSTIPGLGLGTAGHGVSIKEGSGGRMGQTTLVSGTKAITVANATTSTRCFTQQVTPSGTTLTVQYSCVCTAATVTITAEVAAGTINTADGSTLNYILFEPAP